METLIHLYFDPLLLIEKDFIVFYCASETVLERGLEGHAVLKQRPDYRTGPTVRSAVGAYDGDTSLPSEGGWAVRVFVGSGHL